MNMKNSYPDQAFYDLVEQMEVTDLEDLIIGLSDDMALNAKKLEVCLSQRKYLLRKQFECSPQNVARFGELMIMLKERTEAIFNATKTLCRQLHKQWQEGENSGFADFTLETSLKVAFDEQDSELKMVNLLDDYYRHHWGGNLVDTTIYYEPSKREEQLDEAYFIAQFGCHYDAEFQDDWGEGWFVEKFPQLATFPIPYAAHQLLFHTSYALQDIVRIKSLESEIKVTYQLQH